MHASHLAPLHHRFRGIAWAADDDASQTRKRMHSWLAGLQVPQDSSTHCVGTRIQLGELLAHRSTAETPKRSAARASHRQCAPPPHLQRSGLAGSQAGGDECRGGVNDCGGEASSECCASGTIAGRSCCHAAPCGWSTGSATCRGQKSCVAQCLQRARGRHFTADSRVTVIFNFQATHCVNLDLHAAALSGKATTTMAKAEITLHAAER